MNNDVPSKTETSRTGMVEWYDNKMGTSFANVINVQATREQIEIFSESHTLGTLRPIA